MRQKFAFARRSNFTIGHGVGNASFDQFLAAKDALWDNCGSYLGPKADRRQSAARDVHEAALSDIIHAIEKIDQDASADVPVFSAVNFDRVPRTSPVQDTPEATAVRLDAIEDKITQLCKAVSDLSPMSAAPTALPPVAAEIPSLPPPRSSKNPGTENTVVRPSYSQATAKPTASTSRPGRMLARRGIVLTEMAEPQDASANAGFRPQYRDIKKQRRRGVVGSRDDSSLKGNEPRRVLFVYRLDKATTADELNNYLKQSVGPFECVKISHEDAHNASFKVAVPLSDSRKMLNSDFWPSGVCCRHYIPPKTTTS